MKLIPLFVVCALVGSLTGCKSDEGGSGYAGVLRFEQNVRELSKKHIDQLDETRRDLHLAPANIESVVQIALALARQPQLIPTTLDGVSSAFEVPRFADPSWQPCLTGLIHPHTGVQRPITFDPQSAAGRDDVVLAHLNHRLVQRCLRLLRAEVGHLPIARKFIALPRASPQGAHFVLPQPSRMPG